MTNFEEKKQQKIARAEQLADKAKRESEQRYNTASQISSFIPFGQPILVGHHSEGRHRRDLNRIDTNMRKSIEADEKAKYYTKKAARLENNSVINSDDPEALTKLTDKLRGLERNQELMKECNKIIKSKKLSDIEKVEQMQEKGLTEQQSIKMLEPDFCGRIGFASYALQNNNANISTVKNRIQQISNRNQLQTKETEINGVKIVDNIEENRIQAFFNGKPSEEVRSTLKHSGFRWSPSSGCWQSYRHNHSMQSLINVCKSLNN
jgi:hypothetical protein